MKKYALILLVAVMPLVSWAQFTGFQDETVSPVYWTTEDNFVGTEGSIGSESLNIVREGQVGIDASVRTNQGDPSQRYCKVASKTLDGYVDFIGCAIRVAVLPFIFALALVSFIWGVTVMMRNPANEEAQSKGRTFILWGIIGFFVMTSVYALVAILRRTVGLGFNAKDDPNPYLQLKEKTLNLK